MKCWQHHNEKFHKEEYQKNQITNWYIRELQEAKSSQFQYVKRYAECREFDIESVSFKEIQNQIQIVREIKKKSIELPQDNI